MDYIINEIKFYLKKIFIKRCLILNSIIVLVIAILNCFFIHNVERTNDFLQYILMYVTLFIGLLPMSISFINDGKAGFYLTLFINILFLIIIPIVQGDIWYIVVIMLVPVLAIIRYILNLLHHKVKIKPESEPDDPEEKLPYNEMETADSDHDSGDDGGGDDEMSGEGDIDIED